MHVDGSEDWKEVPTLTQKAHGRVQKAGGHISERQLGRTHLVLQIQHVHVRLHISRVRLERQLEFEVRVQHLALLEVTPPTPVLVERGDNEFAIQRGEFKAAGIKMGDGGGALHYDHQQKQEGTGGRQHRRGRSDEVQEGGGRLHGAGFASLVSGVPAALCACAYVGRKR